MFLGINLTFKTTDSGYKTVMDGSGKAVSQWVSAVGSWCMFNIDVVDILKKGRFNIEACNCELEAERAESALCIY